MDAVELLRRNRNSCLRILYSVTLVKLRPVCMCQHDKEGSSASLPRHSSSCLGSRAPDELASLHMLLQGCALTPRQ